MDSTTYSQGSNIASIAGVILIILGHFGITTDIATVTTIIGGIVAIVGIISQIVAHKNMKNAAVAAGATVVNISGQRVG